MTLEVIHRDQKHAQARGQIAKRLKLLTGVNGTIYLGYPDLLGPPSATIDALFVDPGYGVVVFKLNEGEAASDAASNLTQALALLEAELMRQPALRDGRRLRVQLQACWVRPGSGDGCLPLDLDVYSCGVDSLAHFMRLGDPMTPEAFMALQSVVQRSGSLRKTFPKPSPKMRLAEVLSAIASEVSSFDASQAHGALEMVDGPQRIRGLAGSGKTVVLARKAAELHRRDSTSRIVVTYWTRSVKAIIERYIELFLGDAPWDRETLQVLPAFGSASRPGVYSLLCGSVDEPALSLHEAQARYGATASPFDELCRALAVKWAQEPDHRVLWDYVLVDEAQDLPSGFFHLLWQATAPPHRIVWAYDELQTLFGESLPGPKILFGAEDPSLNLENLPGQPQRDVTLRVCYRTPPWALVAAHAIGLGVANAPNYAQWVERQDVWEAVGYQVEGTWEAGTTVRMSRSPDTAPSFFGRVLTAEDSLRWRVFDTVATQDTMVVQAIQRDVQEGGLPPEQVLIVLANTRQYKARGGRIQGLLQTRGLGAIVAGESMGADVFSVPGSITIAGVHRAKGNEAARVYVLDAGVSAYPNPNERSELFVAMTRTSAWLRICGVGEGMERLSRELELLKTRNWVVHALVPTDEQLERVRRLGQDLSGAERIVLRAASSFARDAGKLDDNELRRVLEREPELLDRVRKLLAGQEQ